MSALATCGHPVAWAFFLRSCQHSWIFALESPCHRGANKNPGGPDEIDIATCRVGRGLRLKRSASARLSLAFGRAAEAAPDGYTLSLGNWTSHMGAGALYPVQYDLIRDFEPISLLTFAPMLIVAKNEMPAKDAKDLIAWLKANPDKHRQPPSAQAAPRTYVDSISRIRPAPGSSSCLIVAGRRRCRI